MTKSTKRFFDALPENAGALYVHVSHRFSRNDRLIEDIQKRFGIDNVLITDALSTSLQSFTDFDERIEIEKKERLQGPVVEFSVQRGIDAVIYLCDCVCDGYQNPIFPQDVDTKFHIWQAIKQAELLQKPLIVGYQDEYCFSVKCYEREYITDPSKIKCQTVALRI